MNRAPPRGRWLTRDLVVRLMLPLLAIVIATAALGTYAAQRLTDRVFDRSLINTAQSVAALLHTQDGRTLLALPPEAERVLLYDEVDRTYFSVTEDGRTLAGTPGIATHGRRETSFRQGRAYETQIEGLPVRVALVRIEGPGRRVVVQVAETLEKRRQARQEIEALLLPMGLLVLAAAIAIVLAVRSTLRPLEGIAARWNARSHSSLAPIGDDDDVPRELLPFATALNDLLSRIRAMLERERHFAATAAHQLRTPLTGLQLGLARASESADLGSARAVIAELNSSTQRAARLIQQLLVIGRLDPEGRRDHLHLEPTDLVALARDTGAALADEAVAQSIDLELDAPNTPVVATVQPALVAEALSNLIDNALRYTPRGGTVRIEVLDHPPRLRVSDSGPGIPADERERVLERFTRGRNAKGDGSGLGLSIVQDIAALHDARLDLTDAALGGLNVTISFPDASAASAST